MEEKSMKIMAKKMFVYFLSMALVLPNFSIPAYAREVSENLETEIVEPITEEENVTDEVTMVVNNVEEDILPEEEMSVYVANSGTFGDSDGFSWTYDESTTTLTVTGEDSGINELKNSLPNQVRNKMRAVVFQDCVVVGGSTTRMFEGCSSLTSIDLSGLYTYGVTDMSRMFYGCSSLTSIYLSGLDTYCVMEMEHMFEYCSSLTSIDLSGLDISNVNSMFYMFDGCSSLTSIDLSGLDTSGVEDMFGMFEGCSSLKRIATPKAMAKGMSIELPTEFMDSKKNIITEITSAHCNKVLTKAEKDYDIIYKLNGGKNNADNPATYSKSSATIILKAPKKTGYTFKGWYSDSEFSKEVTYIPYGSEGNKTLYAKWSVNKYDIAFKGNGSTSGSMKKMSDRKYGSKYTLTKNAFQKKGYTFTGWNTKADGTGTTYKNKASVKNLTTKNNTTVTLYAQWKINSYDITYKLNGGKNDSDNPEDYTVNTSTITLKNPTKKGYKFVGWYSDKKLTQKVTKIKKGSTGNKTLYAKWKKK